METELDMVSFTAHDRCDRCGHQALAVAKKGDLELMFCWHDKVKHEDALLKTGWTVIADHGTYESYKPQHLRMAEVPA